MKNLVFSWLFTVLLFLIGLNSFAQYTFDSADLFEFQKRETNFGIYYNVGNEREEMLTDFSRQFEELATGALKVQYKNRFCNFLDYKQETFELTLETGPFRGNGRWIDSTFIQHSTADLKSSGLRTLGSIEYTNRYFYTKSNYTIVQVNAWGRSDLFQQELSGTSIDTNSVVKDINETDTDSRFRYGFEARAGWGIGRLNPVNHFMVADYLLHKYYRGRNFSEEEITQFAHEVARVKHQRNKKTGHDNLKEAEQIVGFINKKMMLSPVSNLETDWMYGEFLPRFQGSRFEFGPFFKYYNREPDFLYGAYLQYKNAKYIKSEWSRNISASVEYNKYKKHDWMVAEIDMSWSYYIRLKNQLDFGVKYVPGFKVPDWDDFGKINHGIIPYIGYYSQVNAKTRVNVALAWRISNNDSLLIPGPEFTVGIYRSRY